jgi:hypothetical protein
MDDSDTLAAGATALDFPALRAQGVTLLQRLAGGTWTDHNTHDPGITILEQVCYALTDLAYRAQYALPDLLARPGADPQASIWTPAQILPISPVTLADLRKLVIDVHGVKSAWIDPVDEPSATYDAAQAEVSHFFPPQAGQSAPPASPNVSEIRVRGLLRVRIEKSDLADVDGGAIRLEAARRLHRARGLGQDFQEIRVLDYQSVRLALALEIDAVADATALLANVYQAIANYLSPPVPFRTLEEMLERGRRVDEIFEGPLLDHGFLDTEDLAQMEKRASLRISDLIHALMAVPGVAAVKSVRFLDTDGQPIKKWLLDIDPDRTPQFDLKNSDIRLERRGLRVDPGIEAPAQKAFTTLALRAGASGPTTAPARDLPAPPGRDRNVANYYSVQYQFPSVYGIGGAGLPESASAERRAQAKQLKAYLLFYDQLLANQFAQLANIGRLFSLSDDTPRSYFSQALVDDGTLGLEELRVSSRRDHVALLQRITENPFDPAGTDPDTGARRRNRFLDHLLARFGEQLRDYGLLLPGMSAHDGADQEQLAEHKRAFLRDYPRIGRDRGSAFDCLEAAAEGSSEFLAGDFADSVALIGKLSDPAPDPLSGYLWAQLDPVEKSALTEDFAARADWEAALTGALNRLLGSGTSIFAADRFAGVSLSEETAQLLGQDPAATGADLVRLNRLLLEDAYPDEIRRSRDPSNLSGLELTLRRKLGIADGGEERFHVVEHVLLRPIAGDANQTGPMLRAAQARDPYSLQVTLVFPSWPTRFQDSNFRRFVEHTVEEETPAHLTAHVLWKDRGAMQTFETAYARWLHRLRNHRRTELGF